mmetsp:Transcript_29520/g.44889  ORF Transcript_29520/g.44889 Transcript_29520/m.44889 type:complete len:210 (+) Transcript_29520:2693-3322(+)
MNDFKKDFELRRNIFGLAAIIQAPEQSLPPVVAEKMPEIMNQLTLLSFKTHTERIDVLKDNEDFVAKGGKEWDSDEEDEEDAGEAIDGDDMGDAEEEKDSDEEWKDQQRLFEKLGPKLHQGKALTQEEMDEFGLGDDDDEEDEDYEYNGGDNSLYASKIDDYDELKILRDTLSGIMGGNATLYNRLMSGVQADNKGKFEGIMGEVDGLI